jgi:hypothetical protein
MGLKGYWLWATSQLDSTCRAPPRVEMHSRGFVGRVLDRVVKDVNLAVR